MMTDPDAPSVLTIEGSPRYLEFSPDGRTFYFARGNPILGDARIVARDMSSGVEREIATVRSLRNLSVSPDGRTLAIIDLDRSTGGVGRLLTVSIRGGEIRELYSAADSTFGFGLNSGIPWTPDGRHLLFVSERDGAAWRISSSGGEPQRLFELPGSDRWRDLRIHPDGSRIGYSSGEGRAEIWMIQNIPGTNRER